MDESFCFSFAVFVCLPIYYEMESRSASSSSSFFLTLLLHRIASHRSASSCLASFLRCIGSLIDYLSSPFGFRGSCLCVFLFAVRFISIFGRAQHKKTRRKTRKVFFFFFLELIKRLWKQVTDEQRVRKEEDDDVAQSRRRSSTSRCVHYESTNQVTVPNFFRGNEHRKGMGDLYPFVVCLCQQFLSFWHLHHPRTLLAHIHVCHTTVYSGLYLNSFLPFQWLWHLNISINV